MHVPHFLIAERERSIYDGSRFDIGRFRAEPTNYERRLHLLTPLTRSLRYALSTS